MEAGRGALVATVLVRQSRGGVIVFWNGARWSALATDAERSAALQRVKGEKGADLAP